MKITKQEYGKLQLIISDIGAQSALIEMGAVDVKDKFLTKIDELIGLIDKAELVAE